MSKVWFNYYQEEQIAEEISVDPNQNLAKTLGEACDKYRTRPAISCLGSTITYEQWNQLSENFAAYLQTECGVKKGDRIAIMLPNLIQFPVVFFACQKVGAVCVNTNPLYTPREMQHQLKDSGATTIIIADLFLDKLGEILTKTDIKNVIYTGLADHTTFPKSIIIPLLLKLKGMPPKHKVGTRYLDALEIGGKRRVTPPTLTTDDLCILQYTGGTTGVSKGAMLSHGNILSNLEQVREWVGCKLIDSEEVILTALPLYHIFALSINFLMFQTKGNLSVLVPKPIPIKNTVKIFKQHKITVMTGVNTLFNALTHDPGFTSEITKDLKFALGGGMAVQKAVSDAFEKIVGIPIIEGFGLTEASPVTHVNPLSDKRKVSSIGLPVPSTDAKVVDEDGNEVPIGESGELIIRGPQVMQGYWNRPEETQKTVRDGWLWTGDIARQDEEGYFFIVDRKKDMILVSGFNVYPNEIEDVLAKHPKVVEAAVIGIPDEKSGEAVKAFVVLKDPATKPEELSNFCKEQLTGYKVPKHFEFRDELPKTNVGKILRRKLREEKKGHS